MHETAKTIPRIHGRNRQPHKTNKDLITKLGCLILIRFMKITDKGLLLNLQKLFCKDCHSIGKVNDCDSYYLSFFSFISLINIYLDL